MIEVILDISPLIIFFTVILYGMCLDFESRGYRRGFNECKKLFDDLKRGGDKE